MATVQLTDEKTNLASGGSNPIIGAKSSVVVTPTTGGAAVAAGSAPARVFGAIVTTALSGSVEIWDASAAPGGTTPLLLYIPSTTAVGTVVNALQHGAPVNVGVWVLTSANGGTITLFYR